MLKMFKYKLIEKSELKMLKLNMKNNKLIKNDK